MLVGILRTDTHDGGRYLRVSFDAFTDIRILEHVERPVRRL
jgi:hypothetical protein